MRSHPFRHEPLPPLPTTPRGHEVAQSFGLTFGSDAASRRACAEVPLPETGEILFLGGASGSGKSSLMRILRRRARLRYRVLNLPRLALAQRPVIDLFDDPAFPVTLRRLSAVGLAELWTWLRRPAELSEGQRWRLRLALALDAAERSGRPVLLACDEFGAVLDRVSACIVARCVRRAVDALPHRLCALLATSHDDLHRALDADIRIECDFGEHRLVRRKRCAR